MNSIEFPFVFNTVTSVFHCLSVIISSASLENKIKNQSIEESSEGRGTNRQIDVTCLGKLVCRTDARCRNVSDVAIANQVNKRKPAGYLKEPHDANALLSIDSHFLSNVYLFLHKNSSSFSFHWISVKCM